MIYDLPDGCHLLADNTRCRQAFRIENKPIWGIQFHAEAIQKQFKSQFSSYSEVYNQSKKELNRILKSFCKTPEANKLITNFANFAKQPNPDD